MNEKIAFKTYHGISPSFEKQMANIFFQKIFCTHKLTFFKRKRTLNPKFVLHRSYQKKFKSRSQADF